MEYSPGDYVTRKSHKSDIIFRVEKIIDKKAILRSCRLRLMADAPLKDLIPYQGQTVKIKKKLLMESYEHLERQQRNLVLNNRLLMRKSDNNNSFREKPVKVLHLDGDKEFLDLSLQNYKNLNLIVEGFFVEEKGQPEVIMDLLKKNNPDILVVTGHDGEFSNKNHRTSEYFIRVVQLARSYNPDLDELVIFAGACQSNYKKLLDCGANYASSPAGKLIHFLDPILIVEKVAFTSIREIISIKDVIKTTISGEGGIGGVETRGKLRLYYP